MSRTCEMCEKKSQKGKKIALIWGVKYRSIRHRQPNLRKVALLVDGIEAKAKICTKCLKTIKANKISGITKKDYSTK